MLANFAITVVYLDKVVAFSLNPSNNRRAMIHKFPTRAFERYSTETWPQFCLCKPIEVYHWCKTVIMNYESQRWKYFFQVMRDVWLFILAQKCTLKELLSVAARSKNAGRNMVHKDTNY